MSTQTTSLSKPVAQAPTSLLRRALLGNAAFSGLSGLLFTLDARPIAKFLGLENPMILTIMGLVLLAYAPFLVWLANRKPIPRWLAWMVIELDVLWIIGSAVLIFTDLVPLTGPGKWAIAIVADVVAVFAIVQYLGLRRQ